jgi:hypothetical protein
MKTLIVRIKKSRKYPQGLIKFIKILPSGEKQTHYYTNDSTIRISQLFAMFNSSVYLQ